jgi:hypothetical protein
VVPDRTVDTAIGTGVSPSSASSQRIGRVNDSFGSFHFMFFSDRSSATTSASSPLSTSTAPRPVSVLTRATCSTPFSVTRPSSDSSTFWPRAKPCTALVGSPSASNAAATFGPRTVRSASGSRGDTSATRTTTRRGVPCTSTAPWVSLVAANLSVTAARTAATVRVTSAGGSSSVPISNSSVAGSVTVANSVGATAGAGVSAMPSGWPSSALRSAHRPETSRARPRILANARARSVVLIAPRESSTLNVCEHLST